MNIKKIISTLFCKKLYTKEEVKIIAWKAYSKDLPKANDADFFKMQAEQFTNWFDKEIKPAQKVVTKKSINNEKVYNCTNLT